VTCSRARRRVSACIRDLGRCGPRAGQGGAPQTTADRREPNCLRRCDGSDLRPFGLRSRRMGHRSCPHKASSRQVRRLRRIRGPGQGLTCELSAGTHASFGPSPRPGHCRSIQRGPPQSGTGPSHLPTQHSVATERGTHGHGFVAMTSKGVWLVGPQCPALSQARMWKHQ
jgi:hypothetical protein